MRWLATDIRATRDVQTIVLIRAIVARI